ncbi:MAG: DUF4230 domain-containing protein [Thermoanaerobaculia bacterium]
MSPSYFRTALTRAALLVLLLLAVFAGFRWGRGAMTRGPRVDSAPVVQAIRQIAQLATVQIEVADVVRYEEVRTIVLFAIPKNATLRLRGTVQGGFDLEHGFSVVAEEATHTLRVSLPPPRILSVDSRVEWFDEKSGWLNPITPEDRTRWTTWSRGALGRAAKDAGLAERATAQAKKLFTESAAAFGWKAVVTIEREKASSGL